MQNNLLDGIISFISPLNIVWMAIVILVQVKLSLNKRGNALYAFVFTFFFVGYNFIFLNLSFSEKKSENNIVYWSDLFFSMATLIFLLWLINQKILKTTKVKVIFILSLIFFSFKLSQISINNFSPELSYDEVLEKFVHLRLLQSYIYYYTSQIILIFSILYYSPSFIIKNFIKKDWFEIVEKIVFVLIFISMFFKILYNVMIMTQKSVA